MEISLGVVVADVSYFSGHMCGSGRNPIHSIFVWVHTFGMLFWMAAWIMMLNCCYVEDTRKEKWRRRGNPRPPAY